MSEAIGDGNALLKNELAVLVGMVARTSLWVAPETFAALPVWAPWTARGAQLYRKGWSEKQTLTRKASGVTLDKREGNVAAIDTMRRALDVPPGERPPNWSVCHIWGYDDPSFAKVGSVTHDPHYFTCVGNMIWLPTALKGLTDTLPAVKEVLRYCAAHLYPWQGRLPGEAPAEVPPHYPREWPTPERPQARPEGIRPMTPRVEAEIAKRKEKLRQDLGDPALLNYPRDKVRAVLTFWGITL